MVIHRKLLKKHKRIHENVVALYDTIRYQVARAQYSNPAIQENKWINIIIEADHKNYPAHAAAIKEELLSIEQKLGQQIISADQWITLQKQTKKKNRLNRGIQFIGRIITVLTVGIYNVFW